MSRSCPLCGKNKPEETLFCDDCAKKVHAEYEVGVPALTAGDNAPAVDDIPAEEETGDRETNIIHGRGVDDPVGDEKETAPEKRKRVGAPLLFVLAVALLSGAFFVYNATIRKNNLDRSGWDAAVKANSTEGYLAYMEAHPQGAHFDEAQAGLYMLKTEEASAWKRMKETDNTSVLRDFLGQHPDSPYAPLVRTRLDSLMWIGALRTNTLESYSGYIMLAGNGGIKGDYIAEARKRYELLFSPQSPDAALLDSIRTTIGGFFASLSTLDHSGMFRYLAPTVRRFFDSGAATREKITGELLVTGAQTKGVTLKFVPDLESVRYEVMDNNHYKANVPLLKAYPKDGATEQVYGYIMHLELDPLFRIVGIFETKPYPQAP